MAVEKSKNVPPFVLWCSATIPTAFDDSMSYYEALCALYKWVQDNIINVVNNNADILKDYIKLVDDLKKYVEDYFKNLDVQEEINNKLDDMAEKGQLAGIIAQFLEMSPVFAYDTIAAMAAAENLSNGSIARVLGNTSAAAGDGAYYKVRTKEGGESADGVIKVAIGDTLIADRIVNPDAVAIESLDDTLNGECKINFVYRGRDGGSCRLIRTGGKNILVDLGIGSYVTDLINYLKAKAIQKIDYIVLSHYHTDHIGGDAGQGVTSIIADSYFDLSDLTVVLPHKGIDWTTLANYADVTVMQAAEATIKAALTSAGITYIEPDDGDTIDVDANTTLKFNNIGSTYYAHYYDAGLYNNFSMIVTVINDKTRTVIFSDAEELAQKWNVNNVDYADIVTAPHHGMNAFSDVDMLRKLNSKYEVIENLYDESDNPLMNAVGVTDQFSAYLRTIGCRVFASNQSGEIEFSIKNNNISVVAAYGTMTTKSNLDTLSGGVEIAAGTDINTIKSVGEYFTRSSSITLSLTNMPTGYTDIGAIRIINEQLLPFSGQVKQTLRSPRYILQRFLWDATTWSDWNVVNDYGMGWIPNVIPDNADVDAYLAAGKYMINGGANYTTISHLPEEGGGSNAVLIVMAGRRNYDTIRQILFTAGNVYWRTGSSNGRWSSTTSNTTWTKWKKFDTTEVEYQ